MADTPRRLTTPRPVTPLRLPGPLCDLIRRQHGVVHGSQLRAHGVDADRLERLVQRRLLVRIQRDLHRVAGLDDDFLALCASACIAMPGAVVGGAAAAALWRFEHMFRPTHPELATACDPADGERIRGVGYRRTRFVLHDDVVARHDAIRVTSRARTWFDCLDDLNPDHALRFTRHVLDEHCDVAELDDVVSRWEASRRRRPSSRPRRLLDELTAPGHRSAA